MSPRLRVVLAIAVLLGVVARLWTDKIAPGEGFALANVDAWGYLYPAYEATYARLARGVLPLWNPYQLCGVPWLAALQTGVLYPPHALYMVLPTHQAMATLALGHLLLAAGTTFAVMRRAGIGFAGAILAGLLFAGRGRLPFLVVVPNMFEAAAWLPLGCLAVMHLAGGTLRRGIALLAVATGMSLLAGYPQYTTYLVYAWATLLPMLLLTERARGVRAWLTTAMGFGAGVALGMALAAAQLLPTHELTASSLRQTSALTVQQMYPIAGPWIRNGTLQGLRDLSLGGHPLSFGIVGLSLLAAAPFARLAGLSPVAGALAWWAVLFGTAALGFAIGPGTGVFEVALYLPGFAWFRVPERILLVTDYCFAIGAGTGLGVLLAAPRAGRVAPIVAAVALGLGWLAARQPLAGAWPLAAGVALLALAVFVPGRRGAGAMAAGLVGLAIYVLFATPPRGLAMPYTAAAISIYDTQRPFYTQLANRLGVDRFWLISPSPPPYQIGPKQSTRFRARTINDYEPFNLRRQAEYFTFFHRGQTTPTRPNDTFLGTWLDLNPAPLRPPVAMRRRLLDLAAVRFVVVPPLLRLRPDVGTFFAEAALGPPVRLGSFLAYPNPHALPRAFVTYRTAPPPDVPDLLARLSDPGFDPLVRSYVEGSPPMAPAADAPARGGPARIVHDDESSVEVEASLEADGLLVLADTYFSGWRATVDGTPAPIVPVNHLFRGVAVPAGQHRVRFEYRPWQVPAGLAVSGLALLVLLGLYATRGELG
jgi:hypothetical protein